ncbi:MAG: hypothetical protein ACMXYF_03140 [Candidatus Woesearchaeota archaeon]
MKIIYFSIILSILFLNGCSSISESSPETQCKESYDRYMDVQKNIRPTFLLEYKKVDSLVELKSFESDYESTLYGDFFNPSQRFGGLYGEESDFKPTYVFAIKQEATSPVERSVIHLCICDGSRFSCGNAE